MPSSKHDTACEPSDKLIDISCKTSPLFSPESMGLSLVSDSERFFNRGFWGTDYFQVAPANAAINNAAIPARCTGTRQSFSLASCTQDDQTSHAPSIIDREMIANMKDAPNARTCGNGLTLRLTQSTNYPFGGTFLTSAGHALAAKSTVDPKQIHAPSPAPESPEQILSAKVCGVDVWLTLADMAHCVPRILTAMGQEVSEPSPHPNRRSNWDTDAGTSSLLDCSSPMSCWGDMASVSSEPSRLNHQLPSNLPDYFSETVPVVDKGSYLNPPQINVDGWMRILAASDRMQWATSDIYTPSQPRSAPTPLVPEMLTVSASQDILGRGLFDLDVEKLLSCPFDDVNDLDYDYTTESRARQLSGMVSVPRISSINLKAVPTPIVDGKMIPVNVYANTRSVISLEGKGRKKAKKALRTKPRIAIANTEGSPFYDCPQCTRPFKRQEHLKRHSRLVHSTIRPHICLQCGKKFLRSDNLSQHVKTHDKQNAT